MGRKKKIPENEVPQRVSKNTFTLKNIDVQHLILSVYFPKSSKVIDYVGDDELPQTIVDCDEQETPISDILQERSKKCYYFLNPHKAKIKLWVTMVDEGNSLPESTKIPCWWDHHTFTTKPLGCPLRFFYNGDVETFETEGTFCSFPCIKAYILDRGCRQKYKESLTLLTLLYSKFFNKIITIPTAGSWKTLEEYGGHLTITQYRDAFGRLEYTGTPNVRRPHMICTSEYIEENKAISN